VRDTGGGDGLDRCVSCPCGGAAAAYMPSNKDRALVVCGAEEEDCRLDVF
jgi:hypothetical protein